MAREQKETFGVEKCECVYCGCVFNGRNAINQDLGTGEVICPECHRVMDVFVGCEFVCREKERTE